MAAVNSDIKILDPGDLVPEIAIIVGTRPSIVMQAPIILEFRRRRLPHFVIHTGQHYSPNMDSAFFADMDLPPPDYRLEGVGAKRTHGGQTAAMLEGIEHILLERRPCLCLVGGDANTNLAGALAARKLHINVGHVEAGERSRDWRMPEEHNRVIIDHISDLLFATGERAARNLEKEGVRGRIHIVGNPIVDATLRYRDTAAHKSDILARFGLESGRYAVLTMHREENVDVAVNLRHGLQGVSDAAHAIGLPVVFLAHPRTGKRLAEFGIASWARELPGLSIHDAIGYLDFLNLLAHAHLVFTDSGGVQQEACIHQVPCVTLRENTEWPETLDVGANRLAGCDPARICAAAAAALASPRSWSGLFGDGSSAIRIADVAERLIADFGRVEVPGFEYPEVPSPE